MHMKFPGLMVALALALAGGAHAAPAASNADLTSRYFAAMVAGGQPKLAELTLFFSRMPKGGDLHHHYSGAIYAEQYLDWVDKQHYCVDKASYRIVSEPAALAAGRAAGTCLSSAEVIADNAMYRELLQRWSIKDFANHGAVQSPPDRQFFDTFGYFGPVASSNTKEGLETLKQRALQENLGYIETIFELAPFTQDAGFDRNVAQAGADLDAQMAAFSATLADDAGFQKNIGAYLANVDASSAGIDDARFTMRYQAYVLRLLSPSQVFSSMLAAFQLASQSPKVVGVNIVGAENFHVSMRDYALHMRMFKFLKAKYPGVKLALHAGELALGMVPPEGLSFHINDAIEVAGADRIGHGIDLAHETNALDILKKMRARGIPVEINLSSNEFIVGIKNEAHPLNLYRKYGVPFVISTDDPGVSRNNLSGEYVLFASRYKTDYAEVKQLSYNSLRYSFLADADKKRLIKALDGRFAAFEADIAAAKTTVATAR
ncbi:adenosine deaminase [Janthinobacterium sp.]|uniref:adenosine deaminase family protein n=1 Tax=Janthinobacterium sp. TaxID=1871054 RepID=UPI00293D9D09|nr:adenosine deaminase [Janthinobacterium sp.]